MRCKNWLSLEYGWRTPRGREALPLKASRNSGCNFVCLWRLTRKKKNSEGFRNLFCLQLIHLLEWRHRLFPYRASTIPIYFCRLQTRYEVRWTASHGRCRWTAPADICGSHSNSCPRSQWAPRLAWNGDLSWEVSMDACLSCLAQQWQ